jgi:DNA uptake protein ComE-like DNA-binding protein
MKLLTLILLGIIAWLVNRLIFITRAYRDDLSDIRYQLEQLKASAARASEAPAPATPSIATDKVNINTASKTRLQTLPGIGAVSAQRIIEARPFATLDELTRVEGFKADQLDRLRTQICL